MSRKSLIDTPTPRQARAEVQKIDDVVEQFVLFTPTTAQKKAKYRLLVELEDNPIASVETLTCEQASKLAGYNFAKYWSEPGFKHWLTNSKEFAARVEYLAHMCLDTAEDILLNDDPKLAGAKVSLIGKVADLANKMPSRSGGGQFADDFINRMNEHQLREYVKQRQSQLLGESSED